MPSQGQRFQLMDIWFEVVKSRGKWIKIKAKIEDPVSFISKKEGQDDSSINKIRAGTFILHGTKMKVLGKSIRLAGKNLQLEASV